MSGAGAANFPSIDLFNRECEAGGLLDPYMRAQGALAFYTKAQSDAVRAGCPQMCGSCGSPPVPPSPPSLSPQPPPPVPLASPGPTCADDPNFVDHANADCSIWVVDGVSSCVTTSSQYVVSCPVGTRDPTCTPTANFLDFSASISCGPFVCGRDGTLGPSRRFCSGAPCPDALTAQSSPH